jgi:hypothetical protein
MGATIATLAGPDQTAHMTGCSKPRAGARARHFAWIATRTIDRAPVPHLWSSPRAVRPSGDGHPPEASVCDLMYSHSSTRLPSGRLQ